VLTRIFHELWDVSTEKSACLRQGDIVAVSPEEVGPSGANISSLREIVRANFQRLIQNRGRKFD
jgi:hypothetical protein